MLNTFLILVMESYDALIDKKNSHFILLRKSSPLESTVRGPSNAGQDHKTLTILFLVLNM